MVAAWRWYHGRKEVGKQAANSEENGEKPHKEGQNGGKGGDA